MGPDRHSATDDVAVDGATLDRDSSASSPSESEDLEVRLGRQRGDVTYCAVRNETGNAFTASSCLQVLAYERCLEIGLHRLL